MKSRGIVKKTVCLGSWSQREKESVSNGLNYFEHVKVNSYDKRRKSEIESFEVQLR